MTKYLDHKPCPKCKSDNLDVYRLEGHDGRKGYWIKCNKCGYELEGMCGSREEAWRVWDRIDRKDNKFKPCFICGCSIIEYGKVESTGKYWFKCVKCGNYIELDAPALEDAIKEWNDIELIDIELDVNRCNKCGGELIDLIKWRGYHVVKCRRCGYYGGWLGASKASSINEWNKVNKQEDDKNELIKDSGDLVFKIKKKVTDTGEWYILNISGWDEELLSCKITLSYTEAVDLMMLLRDAIDMAEGVFRCKCGNGVFKRLSFFNLEGPVYEVECYRCGKKYEISADEYKNIGNVFVKRG